MTFEELLDQAIAMLQRRGRVTYGALKRQFNLDDAYLEDLKAEIIKGQRLAVDEDGEVLVWMGECCVSPHPRGNASAGTGAPTARLYAVLSDGKDLRVPCQPGRRAQAGHGAVCRHQGLHRTHPRS